VPQTAIPALILVLVLMALSPFCDFLFSDLNCRVTTVGVLSRGECLGTPNGDTGFDLGFGPHCFDPPCLDWPYDRFP
jgi:hypothetical protein